MKSTPLPSWPEHPLFYEIDTWPWLDGLRKRYSRSSLTLEDIPAAEWDALAELGFDAVWLMGVWERSPRGRDIALRNAELTAEFRQALPDFRPEDVTGSPYCVKNYSVDPRLGGPEGLAAARAELRRRGMRLILDFVPNHTAPDHPWTTAHPEYYIPADGGENAPQSADRLEAGGRFFACARDPNLPPWPDVLQLNAFHPGLRQAARDTLLDIARQADGVRCDMAMLLLNRVFGNTWGARAGPAPQQEYWRETIAAVKRARPDFLFMAEAYWDCEFELLEQGFDYCYDKRLYDRLVGAPAEDIRLHLTADVSYQSRLVRFLENHDEPRVRAVLDGGKERAAAIALATLPGAKMFHLGQIKGRRIRLPVFLGRFPEELADPEMEAFYRMLLGLCGNGGCSSGAWALCERTGWPDNSRYLDILAWCWRDGERRRLVVINYSAAPAQARVRLPWDDIRGKAWRLVDRIGGQTYDRDGDEMAGPGLYVVLRSWQSHVFDIEAK